MNFTVAIVGRPNVGKSTLFNRLVGQRLALVDDTPGVTRDRRQGVARLGDLEFAIVDTAGLEEADAGSLAGRMQEQTMRAVEAADVALLVMDARAGVTPLDRHFAELLRRQSTPVILVANKTEGKNGIAGAYEAFELGLGAPVAVSAEHGEGMGDLFDALEPYGRLSEEGGGDFCDTAAASEKPLMLAVAGRPNVGKSTLVNRLIGQDRMLTGPEAGITRDAISVDWEWEGRKIRLVDTAGLRRAARIEEKLEKLSAADTLRAIRFAEVVVLVIDAMNPMEKQELTLARMVENEGRAIVLAVNKWDLVSNPPQTMAKIRDRLQTSLAQLHGMPVIPLSAATGAGLDKLMTAVFRAHEIWNIRIPTPQLNRWLAETQERHPPPLVDGRRLRLRYMTQANIRPPTFALFASKPGDLPDSYRRYLTHALREDFGLAGVPIRIMLRKSKNPYAEE